MPFSRYLYSKVMEQSKDRFSYLVLNKEEIEFLSNIHITFYFDKDLQLYVVDTKRLKELFSNC